MYEDFVFPKNNEAELIKLANKLNSKLIFVYSHKTNKSQIEKIKSKFKNKVALYVENPNQLSNKNNFDLVMGLATRENAENSYIKYLVNSEILEDRDKLYQKASGLNHIITKIMQEKNKKYLINFNLALNDPRKMIGRFKQNTTLLNKKNIKIRIISGAKKELELRNGKDLKAFGELLGVKNYF